MVNEVFIAARSNRMNSRSLSFLLAAAFACSLVMLANPPCAKAQTSTPVPTQAEAMRQAQDVASSGNDATDEESDESNTLPTDVTPSASAAPVAAPRPPETFTLPGGTELSIRLLDPIDSEIVSPGTPFRGTLDVPVILGARVVLPADAELTGRVVETQRAGQFTGQALLALELTNISYNGQSYAIRTDQWVQQSEPRGADTAAKVGAGATIGAIAGGIVAGGRGLGLGALLGAGTGAAVQAGSRPPEVHLDPEALLTFHLEQPVSVFPAAHVDRADRQPIYP